jgi:lysine decarboxylase
VLGHAVAAPGPPASPPAACFGEYAMSPRDAFFAEHDVLAVGDAAGRICADSIAAYPPGIANVLPGERLTEPLIAYLLEMHLRGFPLRGTWDERTGSVRVVRTS